MSSKDSVLGNVDLVRALLQNSADGVPLLSTSRALRDSMQPCARHLERWARDGCHEDEQLTEDQRRCLNSIGGREGVFCSGLYTVTRLDEQQWASVNDTPAASLLGQVSSLTRPSNRPEQGSVVRISFDTVRVRVIITGIATTEALNSLEVSNEHGAPFTGYPCDVTHDQTTELLSSLLTRTGTVHMPCPGAPNGASLLVPRRIGVRVFRREGGDDWLLLKAGRR
jgi:hypothetical protein